MQISILLLNVSVDRFRGSPKHLPRWAFTRREFMQTSVDAYSSLKRRKTCPYHLRQILQNASDVSNLPRSFLSRKKEVLWVWGGKARLGYSIEMGWRRGGGGEREQVCLDKITGLADVRTLIAVCDSNYFSGTGKWIFLLLSDPFSL